jgi:uncharacterized circularly permuted ATP-grasp superfamily protein/uncharacterized alpha-E superfamily protein
MTTLKDRLDTAMAEPPAAGPADGFEELSLASGKAADVYRKIERLFLGQGRDQQQRLQSLAHKLMRDLGVIYPLSHEAPEQDHVVPFDLFPRVLDSSEWDHLSRGAAQRVRIWNAFLTDIYSHQEVLKAGIIPFQLVYNDPGYLRAAVGWPAPEDMFVHAAAFDLARDAGGRWVVIEDHVSNLTGPSYALQARSVLSHVFPDLLETVDIRRVQTYPTELLERLQTPHQGRATEPRVVMLSSDVDTRAYYEHGLLARQMGIPLVRGSDLIVLNTRVFLKTIGGLEPIDVIYRQIDENLLDPLEFSQDTLMGVPGLMNCVRKDTVCVANAMGASLANNKAIAAFMHRLARFYFRESLILPTVERWLCFDPDQFEIVLGQIETSRLCDVSGRKHPSAWLPREMTETAREALLEQIRSARDRYVAEPVLPLSRLPVLGPEGLDRRHAGLRLFAWGGPNPGSHPCALTRYAAEAGSRNISFGLGAGVKDTWVLRNGERDRKESAILLTAPQRRLRLSSRIADSLYWIGRYQSRAESTTRILKVLQQLQIEDQSFQNLRSWAPLWEALARATGHATNFFKRSALVRRQSVSKYILLDPDNPSSVISSIRLLRANARSCRESVPPELWAVVNILYQRLEAAAVQSWSDQTELPELQRLEEEILNQLDAFTGSTAKNMLRDDAWHFWHMGAYVERAINTVLVARQVFMKRQDGASAVPQRDESNLDAVLRIMACQYAYRSLFQTRPLFQNVAALLFQDRQLPRSVLFCLRGIQEALQEVFGDEVNPLERSAGEWPPLRHCAHLIGEIEFADFAPYFDPDAASKSKRLRPWLDGVSEKLQALANGISDHYLHHQTFKILR